MTDEITFTLTPKLARVAAALMSVGRKNILREIEANPEEAAAFSKAYAGVDISDMLRAINEVTELFLHRTTKVARGETIYNDAGPESVST